MKVAIIKTEDLLSQVATDRSVTHVQTDLGESKWELQDGAFVKHELIPAQTNNDQGQEGEEPEHEWNFEYPHVVFDAFFVAGSNIESPRLAGLTSKWVNGQNVKIGIHDPATYGTEVELIGY